MTVIVFHNIGDNHWFGYNDGDPLVPVARFDLGDAETLVVADHVYRLLNVGDDPAFGEPDPVAVDYRDRRNRSLSVGDVLRIGNEWLACDRFGWSTFDEPPVESIVRTSTHGTTYDPSAEAVTS